MLLDFLKKVNFTRHFWRNASFDDIGALYVSRFLRLLAINLSSVFILIFLYELGYSLSFIAVYLIAYYIVKAIGAIVGGFYVAKYGPKHGIVLSNLLYIPTLIIISRTEELGMIAVVAGMITLALSTVIHNVSYDVNFSKIKTIKKAGRQLGIVSMIEKAVGGLAPVIGGLLAIALGPEVIMLISAVIFALATIPLLRTEERSRLNQKINFKKFPWRKFWRTFLVSIGIGFDYASGQIWSILVPIFIFTGQNSYGVIGALSSTAAIVGIVAAMAYGRFVDKGEGLKLLQIPVLIKSLALAIRGGFITTPTAAVVSNLVSESTTTGYNMAYYKGIFDVADRSGARIVYMVAMNFFSNIVAAIASVIILISLNSFNSEEIGLRFFLVISAIGVISISLADFPIYRKERVRR